MKKIKLIWDFRGSVSAKTAEHHEIHLKEYLEIEKYAVNITGYEELHEMHSIAYLVIEEKDLITFRDQLKPHRAEYYDQE
jgi:hypothetical protein